MIVLLQIRQWAEIQAYSRKMSLTEFLSFAEQKKSCLQDALEVCVGVYERERIVLNSQSIDFPS